jgi:oligoendopeptidase F
LEKKLEAIASMRPFLFLLCMSIHAVVANAQSPPAPPLSADLGRYYFKSPEAETTARVELDSAMERLGKFQGQLNSGQRLHAALRSYEEVLKLYRHHKAYLRLQCSLNRKDPGCDAGKLESVVNAETAFLIPEILAIPKEQLQAFQAAEPGLKTYQFALDNIRRDAPHVLPNAEQAFLDRLHPEIADWQYDLYEQILGDTSFGTVQTATGPLDVVRQRNQLASHPDARVREEAFKRRLNGFASRRDLLAFALIHTVKAQDSLAKAHHYPDAPTRKYSSMYLDPSQTRALLVSMAQHGEVVKRFEKIRAADFQRSNRAELRAWDLSAPQPDFVLPTTPLAETPGIFHQAFADLGAEYQEAFDALLNPVNGRADVLPGGAVNRYSAGFSVGFIGSPAMLFVGRYDGTYKDLSVIAHEGGHATHRSLMTAHGVTPLYADGPSFLFESFAVFNELVLADYLAERAGDDEQFSIFPATTPELRNRWAAVSLMYEDPLYDVNYVDGGLLALKYFQLYSANREQFVPRYVALLKNGFDAPPAALLKQFLNIDLLDGSILSDDLALLNRRLDQLEAGAPH